MDITMTERNFGEYVRYFRICNEMTLREASKKTGIDATRLSQIETHRADSVKAHEVSAIAKAYEIDDLPHYEKLFNAYEQNESTVEHDKVILAALRSGTPPEEMAARFGVLVCKATEDDVEDFKELCE